MISFEKFVAINCNKNVEDLDNEDLSYWEYQYKEAKKELMCELNYYARKEISNGN